MKTWQQVPDETYSKRVQVQMGAERELIENCIKEDIVFTKTFGSDNLNISVIKPKHNSFLEDASFDNLQIDSKPPQLNLNLSKSEDRVIEPDISVVSQFKLQAPASNLFALQYGESRISQMQKSTCNFGKERIKTIESRLVNEQLNKSLNVSMKTAQCQDFTSSQLNETVSNSHNRALDLIILAVIAAFFVALGNNLGRILG